VERTSAEALASAVASALAQDAWRRFDDFMLARRVVGAIDSYALSELVTTVPGAEVGSAGPVEPDDDDRVAVLMRVLGGWNWRGFTLEQLCRHLVASLRALRVDGKSSPVSVWPLPDGR
jgi:hypothetical protein